MKSHALHTVWCNISSEAAGGKFEIDHPYVWSFELALAEWGSIYYAVQKNGDLRATFCNHRESPDNFSFFESLILSPKISFDELILKTTLKTSSDIYFFKNFRKSDRAPKDPIFPTSQNSPEMSNSIQITHKAPSIFLLHVTHDKVFLSEQMTISHGFYNDHLWMPRSMIKNSSLSKRIKCSWYASFWQSYFMESKQYVSAFPTEHTIL